MVEWAPVHKGGKEPKRRRALLAHLSRSKQQIPSSPLRSHSDWIYSGELDGVHFSGCFLFLGRPFLTKTKLYFSLRPDNEVDEFLIERPLEDRTCWRSSKQRNCCWCWRGTSEGRMVGPGKFSFFFIFNFYIWLRIRCGPSCFVARRHVCACLCSTVWNHCLSHTCLRVCVCVSL